MIIKKLNECERFVAGDGTLLREVLHPGKDAVSLGYSLAHAVVKPFEASLPHKLRSSEVYYILEGEGLLTVDGETVIVGPGDSVYVPPDAVQHIHNTGAGDLAFLCIV